MAYEGSIELISGLVPKNGQNFPLIDAKDVRVDDSTRLDAALNGVLKISGQSLSDDQKRQARESIGAASASDLSVLEPTASASDVGKVLTIKAVSGGKATEYEFGDTVLVDDTLTQAGMAADAKATGDELKRISSSDTSIKTRILQLEQSRVSYSTDQIFSEESKSRARNNIGAASVDSLNTLSKIVDSAYNVISYEKPGEPSDYAVGMYRPDTGTKITSSVTNRIYSVAKISGAKLISIDIQPGYKYLVYAYTTINTTDAFVGYYYNGGFITSNPLEADAWLTKKLYIPSIANNYYLMLIVANEDDTAISTAEASNITTTITKETVENAIDFGACIIYDNTLCRNGINLNRNLKTWKTVDFYPLNGEKCGIYYTNVRTFVSEYTEASTSSLIRTTPYTNKGVVKINPETRYIRLSYMKTIPDNEIIFVAVNTTTLEIISDIGRDLLRVPKTMGIANADAAARQLANIEYTTVAPMPIINSDGYVPAGTKLKGVPYSSTRSVCKYVGQHVSLYTFLSAIQNPRSVVYTRRIKYGRLGKTYYGSTCFTYTSYANGSRLGYFDNEIAHIYDKEYEEISPYDIQPGDCFLLMTDREDNTRGGNHCLFIHDVYKDKYGRILSLTIGQLKPPTAVISAELFVTNENGLFVNGAQEYRAYRVNKRVDRKNGNIDYGTYEHLDFVQGYEDEIVSEPEYPDIMTEYGDKACVEAGTDVEVDILNSTGYNKIEVYKNDTLISTRTTLTDFVMSNIEYGSYSFRLVGDDKQSECQLIVADISASYNSQTKIVTFSSRNATPVFVTSYYDWTSSPSDAGVQNRVMRFTEEEVENGQADVSSIVGTNCPNVQIGFLTNFGVAMWWSNKLENEWEAVTPQMVGG